MASTQKGDATFRFALKAFDRSRQQQTGTARQPGVSAVASRDSESSYLQRGGSGALTMVQILACTASMYTPVSL